MRKPYTMKIQDAATCLGVTVARVRVLIAQGRLAAKKDGAGNRGNWWFNPISVHAFARLPRRPGRPRKKKGTTDEHG